MSFNEHNLSEEQATVIHLALLSYLLTCERSADLRYESRPYWLERCERIHSVHESVLGWTMRAEVKP